MKKNVPKLKYNDLKYLMELDGDPFDGMIVDDASLSVMLRMEKIMQRLCPRRIYFPTQYVMNFPR